MQFLPELTIPAFTTPAFLHIPQFPFTHFQSPHLMQLPCNGIPILCHMCTYSESFCQHNCNAHSCNWDLHIAGMLSGAVQIWLKLIMPFVGHRLIQVFGARWCTLVVSSNYWIICGTRIIGSIAQLQCYVVYFCILFVFTSLYAATLCSIQWYILCLYLFSRLIVITSADVLNRNGKTDAV